MADISNKDATAVGSGLSDEIRTNVRKVREIEETERGNRTIGEKVAERIAAFCGSMVFVYVHVVWFAAWLVINSVFTRLAFDPFPYTFLTLCVSLEAIFLSTFILISQNQETALTERRNNLDLQINMLAEHENTKALELLQEIARKVGVPCDPETEDLMEPVEPGKVVQLIIAATKGE